LRLYFDQSLKSIVFVDEAGFAWMIVLLYAAD